MCGTGVISEIARTLNPMACTARIAFSRPGPGPFTKSSTSCKPSCWAAFKACSAARRAAKGVLLREPLKPAEPAEPQEIVLPSVSVTVTIVLLKEAKICTCPEDRVRFPFLRPMGGGWNEHSEPFFFYLSDRITSCRPYDDHDRQRFSWCLFEHAH